MDKPSIHVVDSYDIRLGIHGDLPVSDELPLRCDPGPGLGSQHLRQKLVREPLVRGEANERTEFIGCASGPESDPGQPFGRIELVAHIKPGMILEEDLVDRQLYVSVFHLGL